MKITRAELERLYYSMTYDQLSERLGVSRATAWKLIKEAGIPLKGKGVYDHKGNKKVEVID